MSSESESHIHNKYLNPFKQRSGQLDLDKMTKRELLHACKLFVTKTIVMMRNVISYTDAHLPRKGIAAASLNVSPFILGILMEAE